jgi:hypothetical protein
LRRGDAASAATTRPRAAGSTCAARSRRNGRFGRAIVDGELDGDRFAGEPFERVAAPEQAANAGRGGTRPATTVITPPTWGTRRRAVFVLLRRRSFAIVAMILGLTVTYVVTHGGWLLANAPADHFAPSFADIALFGAVQTVVILVAVRFGLLTMLVASLVSMLLTLAPIAIDSSVPYASSSRLIVATVIALAAYGWHTELAGRPMLGAIPLQDEPARRA